MANFKNSKNLLSQRAEYARYFDNLRGVDFSSDQNDVADSRFAYLVNMYKDYRSGQGGAVETIPGFRIARDFGGKVNGIHIGDGNIFVHVGSWLYHVGTIDENGNATIWEDEKHVAYPRMPNEKTISFYYEGYLYLLGGGSYFRIEYNENGYANANSVANVAYLPTTWSEIAPGALKDSIAEDYGEGRETEQRNLLNPKYKVTYIADGATSVLDLKEAIDNEWHFENNISNIPQFPRDFKVVQYGVELPLAYNESNIGVPRVPEGYPNAIYRITPNTGDGIFGQIALVNAPPKPEKNTWNPDKGKFDYTSGEITAGTPETEGYKWPFAFSAGHAGIEVTVKRNIKIIGGVENPGENQHEIISNCRLAALFDGHVFLGGNPNYPNLIFYNVIKNDESGLPDATYFGQLNFVRDGASNSKIIAMMSVGDSLMVMKEDSDEEDSIYLHVSKNGPSDVEPILYPSQRGHKGIGCYGPCFNFRDDPIFLSKYGVDALGHVSTKYRRAIKHRSSLIDAKLLNCDLRNASIAEWGGYLMILTEGKIFMADSRQMYATEGNNTEYEWYYLEDIGVYTNQFDEYVFAEFPRKVTNDELLEITGDVELLQADAVMDENGVKRNLIGTSAFKYVHEIRYFTNPDGEKIYYKELDEYDEYTSPTGRKIKYYVEPSGGKTGGTFDAAVMLKTIGEDLFFVTKNGVLCKFNFDMRDPETGLIPNEYYDFNGRAIFSGCATKMDNCGIPHLTKSTVKKSVVIKTRTFTYSGMKVKVRTNRMALNQIARIINGQATFNDPSFKDYTFSMTDKSIFSVNEKEKKWVEKQIFIYSDEFRRPFALHYLAYRYNVAGRYKE